jgi:ATP-dependent DNA ligase
MLTLINPVKRAEPFDDPDWLFEPNFDRFRAAADTVRGRMISRNGSRMRRFEPVLDLLPKDCVLDGELVVLGKKVSKGARGLLRTREAEF